MDINHFVKVFDVLDSGFKDWYFPAFGLIFVFVGLVLFLFPRLLKSLRIPYFEFRETQQKLFRYGFLGFAVIWTLIAFVGPYSIYLRHKNLVQDNRCLIAEGAVENFVPMPYGGHAQESFSVSGVKFEYSDYVVTDAFNNTSSHGGPISHDSYVRICYDPNGNAILRLEIRGYQGPLKDYSSVKIGFPNPESNQIRRIQPGATVSWYGNLIVIFSLLDFAGIFFLFEPYLRTFFQVEAKPLHDCPVARAFGGEKLKLKNCLVHWDRESGELWLRPRGWNLRQVPLMVARFKADASGKSLIEQQIRFSSGFPLIMMVFFWTAYQFFSAVEVSGFKAPPTEFIGFAVILFVISSVIGFRRLRSRMEILVQEALVELKRAQSAF